MMPWEWGQTSVAYRTDLYDLEGEEESWDMLWNPKYAGKLGMLAGGGDAWWCAAIKAGVPFDQIHTDEAFEKISAVLREQRPLIRMYTDDTTSSDTALAAGEIVAVMAWNSSVVTLSAQGVPVKFAKPKEGALTWVCGQMLHKDAPNIDSAYDILNSLISESASVYQMRGMGYGAANRKAFAQFSDQELAALGLSRNPMDVLTGGPFRHSTDGRMGSADDLDLGTDQARLLGHGAGCRNHAGAIMTVTGLQPLARPGALTRFLHRHEGWRGHLLLAPALILMAVAILFPLGMTLSMSTWSLSGYNINTTPGIGNYAAMAENPMFRVLILRTLTVAAACTLITVILVYPMAYFVAFHTYRNKALWLIVLTSAVLDQLPSACLRLEGRAGAGRRGQHGASVAGADRGATVVPPVQPDGSDHRAGAFLGRLRDPADLCQPGEDQPHLPRGRGRPWRWAGAAVLADHLSPLAARSRGGLRHDVCANHG